MKAVEDQVPYKLIRAFAESILEGNAIYCSMSSANKVQDTNLSIPDAIHGARDYSKGLKEWVCHGNRFSPLRSSLIDDISSMHRYMCSISKME